MGARKPTARLDLHAYYDLSARLIAGRAHKTYGRPLEKHVRHFASSNGPRPVTGKRDTEAENLSVGGGGMAVEVGMQACV